MKTTLLATLLAITSVPAVAATISVTDFTKDAYTAALSGSTVRASEDFEGFSEANVDNGFSTAVGSFSTAGGVGSGGTVRNADFANDGSKLAVRDGNVYGRKSTTSALSGDRSDNKFLDSNDTYGIVWNVSTGSLFDRIVLTLSDAADTGATMWIGGFNSEPITLRRQRNGNQKVVQIDFDELRSDVTLYFFNTNRNGNARRNDGFSIDDISVAEVPLPAAGFLLLGGLGGLAAFGRRKTTK